MLSGTRVMDRMMTVLLHHFTLKESMPGLINEDRENDILVFWPEIE